MFQLDISVIRYFFSKGGSDSQKVILKMREFESGKLIYINLALSKDTK